MEDELSREWLVEIFLGYQESIDRRRKSGTGRQWLREALDSDREREPIGSGSAANLDSL